MRANSRLTRAVVALAVGVIALTGCTATPAAKPSPTPHLSLKIGALLPQTGAFSSLEPAEAAGITLAANDINQAALGITVDVTTVDSGDATGGTAKAAVAGLLAKKGRVDAIVGPTSNDVVKLVAPQVTGAGVVMISPEASGADLSTLDDHGLFWRTAPSDAREGEVLAHTMSVAGTTLGLIVLQTSYGTSVGRAITDGFEKSGGRVLTTQPIAANATDFSAQVAAVAKAKPDVVAIVALTQATTIIPALIGAGIPAKSLYLVDGDLAAYGSGVPVSMEGVTGVAPGPVLDPFLRKQLLVVDPALTRFAYAPESYDAVVLLALAALAARSTDGTKIAGKLRQVSGGTGKGEKATDFASAAQIILAGDRVDYDGYSGKIGFDAHGDPTQAVIGVFRYGADNTFTRIPR